MTNCIDFGVMKKQLKDEILRELQHNRGNETFSLDEIYSTHEAEQKWGLSTGAVRQSCVRGPLKKYIDLGLVKKSGNVWIVTEKAMREVYGEPKN